MEIENHLKTGGEQLEFKNRASGMHEINPICVQSFHDLKIRRKFRYLIFVIGDTDITIEKAGLRNETLDDFKKSLPYTDCRFCIYDCDYTTPDSRMTSKLWFICWFPHNANPYNKMAYASAKHKFSEILTGSFDAQAASVDEIFQIVRGTLVDNDEEDDDNEFDDDT